jgi:hypothetical protein
MTEWLRIEFAQADVMIEILYRATASPQPSSRRERKMQSFKSVRSAQSARKPR